jgi:hypothetical protein
MATLALTGTLMGGYAGDLYNFLYRFEAAKMKEKGYTWGTPGRSDFVQRYGVVEQITIVPAEDNACSDAKITHSVRERPGASPLLFADFLMNLCAFVNLEDISEALPPYEESVVGVAMDSALRHAYEDLQEDMVEALKANRKNRSVLSQMLNSLLLYPDHPFDLGDICGKRIEPDTGRKVSFLISRPASLPKDRVYAKERKLIEEIERELAQGRRCQVYAVYTQKHDVTARLAKILTDAGIRGAVLKARRHAQTRSVVSAAVEARRAGRDLPSQTGGNWTRPAGVSHHPVLRKRVLAAHAAASQPPVVENRSTLARACEVSLLRGDDADKVSPVDGQETADCADAGRQVLWGGAAGH